ncbi:DUF881 domain-containing protein [Alkalihalobacterium bogoriense]|uniref:DUF881 domain-containing protein n=1 Tax=Alkalihalobacterium bogoriense TaxID=246272 RepID=UPI0004789916|nr:DUF881 domain-containing protein [Alkalihalobacterium bogoriense]
MKDKRMVFTFVMLIIGFMMAVQFQSTKEPTIRDTRDIRELRNDLQAEQERHQQLVLEIENHLSLLHQYEGSFDNEQNVEQVILEQIEQLRKEAGLTEKSGQGIIITIDEMNDDFFIDRPRRSVPPELLRFLVNELNFYGAKDISIGGHRVISTTSFRGVGGVTQLNGGRRLPPLPIQVKVLADDAEKLHNHMVISESNDYFEIEGFSLKSEPINYITLPPFDQTPRVRYMELVKED